MPIKTFNNGYDEPAEIAKVAQHASAVSSLDTNPARIRSSNIGEVEAATLGAIVEFLKELEVFDSSDEMEDLLSLTEDLRLWSPPTPEELAFFDDEFDERVYRRVMAAIQQSPSSNHSSRI